MAGLLIWPPVIERLDVVGSYDLFATSAKNPPSGRQDDLGNGPVAGHLAHIVRPGETVGRAVAS